MAWDDLVSNYKLVTQAFQGLTARVTGLPISERWHPSLFHLLQLTLLHISVEIRAWINPATSVHYPGEANATLNVFTGSTTWDNYLARVDQWGEVVLRPTLGYFFASIGMLIDHIVEQAQKPGEHSHADLVAALEELRFVVGLGPAPAGTSLAVRVRGLESRLGDPGTADASTLEGRIARLENLLAGMPPDWQWDHAESPFDESTRTRLAAIAAASFAYGTFGRWFWHEAAREAANLNSPDHVLNIQEILGVISAATGRLLEIESALNSRSASGSDLVAAAFAALNTDAILREFRFTLQRMVQAQLDQAKPLEGAAEKAALGTMVDKALTYLSEQWGLPK